MSHADHLAQALRDLLDITDFHELYGKKLEKARAALAAFESSSKSGSYTGYNPRPPAPAAPEPVEPVGRVIADPDEGHIFVPRIRGDWSMLGKDLFTSPAPAVHAWTPDQINRTKEIAAGLADKLKGADLIARIEAQGGQAILSGDDPRIICTPDQAARAILDFTGLDVEWDGGTSPAEHLLRSALPDAVWNEKLIHCGDGEVLQSWMLQVYITYPSKSDLSAKEALDRALGLPVRYGKI